jgi:hypothetical protein
LRSSGSPQNYKNLQRFAAQPQNWETCKANLMPSILQRQPFELVIGPANRRWPKCKNRATKFAAEAKSRANFMQLLAASMARRIRPKVIHQLSSFMNLECNTVKKTSLLPYSHTSGLSRTVGGQAVEVAAADFILKLFPR